MKRFYIDFDNTLFDTDKFCFSIIDNVSREICKHNKDVYFDEVVLKFKDKFVNEKLSVFKIITMFAQNYDIDLKYLKEAMFSQSQNIKNFLYDDSVDFLKLLSQKGYEINILTYSSVEKYDYQMKKMLFSGICEYVNNIFICSKNKGLLGLNYQENDTYFIDDNPSQLQSLYDAGVDENRLFRIIRENSKYFTIGVENFKSLEFKRLKDIKIN